MNGAASVKKNAKGTKKTIGISNATKDANANTIIENRIIVIGEKENVNTTEVRIGNEKGVPKENGVHTKIGTDKEIGNINTKGIIGDRIIIENTGLLLLLLLFIYLSFYYFFPLFPIMDLVYFVVQDTVFSNDSFFFIQEISVNSRKHFIILIV